MPAVPSLVIVKVWDNLPAITSESEMQFLDMGIPQICLGCIPQRLNGWFVCFKDYLLYGLKKAKLDSSFMSN